MSVAQKQNGLKIALLANLKLLDNIRCGMASELSAVSRDDLRQWSKRILGIIDDLGAHCRIMPDAILAISEPDLLAALEGLVAAIETHGGFPKTATVMIAARAAITLARGRQE